MIKVIALDLDNTLLTSNNTISSKTVRVLQQCNRLGYKIVIATGRMHQSVAKIPFEFETDMVICSNGAVVYEGLDKIREDMIPPETALQIVDYLGQTFPELMVTAIIGELVYVNHPPELSRGWIVAEFQEVINRPVDRVIFKMNRPEYLEGMQRMMPSGCRVIVTDRMFVEIISATASKAAALQSVLDRWNLSFDNVIAFGDDLNDLELIGSSKIGVAMGNAHPEVKRIADAITLSHDEDGIAYYLEKFIIEASA